MVALFVCPNDGMLECLKNLFGKDRSFYLKLLVTQKNIHFISRQIWGKQMFWSENELTAVS